MRVLIAVDSFKGSLSTWEAGNAISEGIHAVFPDAKAVISPLADGGEGTVDAIVSACGGRLKEISVHGPLGERASAVYGILDENKTAVIEMAAAAGLPLVPQEKRNPLDTSTFGVGEMIADAIREEACRNFIIGIGGSATNDGGIGMLQALGFSFLDANGEEIPHGARGMENLHRIETGNVMAELSDCHFSVACDVKNPLCGENGCSAVFAPQKGGTPEMIEKMDGWLSRYAVLTKRFVNENADEKIPGCGAAGGLGFAFLSYLNAELSSGIHLVIEACALEEKIKNADIVITGEGRLDGQSCMGKAPVGVAMLAKKYGKPVIAVSGCVTSDAGSVHAYGIDAFFPILRTPCSLAQAMEPQNAYRNLKMTSEEIFRLFRATLFFRSEKE